MSLLQSAGCMIRPETLQDEMLSLSSCCTFSTKEPLNLSTTCCHEHWPIVCQSELCTVRPSDMPLSQANVSQADKSWLAVTATVMMEICIWSYSALSSILMVIRGVYPVTGMILLMHSSSQSKHDRLGNVQCHLSACPCTAHWRICSCSG